MMLKYQKKIKRAYTEVAFWFKREASLTLIFWLAVLLAVFIRWFYLK